MGKVLLVQVERKIAAAFRRGAGAALDGSFEEAAGPEQAIARLEREAATVEALVLGPRLAEPVRIAQRAHALDRDLAVLILSDPERYPEVARALQVAPFLGDGVRCRPVGAAEALAAELVEAVEQSRQRRSYRATIAALQARVPVPTPLESRAAEYLGQLLDHVPIGVVAVDAHGLVLAWNRRAGELLGRSEAEALGTSVLQLFAGPERAKLADLLGRPPGKDEGRAALLERTGAEGRAQLLEVTAAPLTGRTGEPGALLLFRDVTDQVAAERARERATQIERFLAGSSELLASSLDLETTLLRVARLAVPTFADWCIVDVVGEDTIHRVAVAAADPHKEEALRELQRRYPPDWSSPQLAARVLRTGQPVFFPEFPENALEQTVRDAEHLRLIRLLDPRSVIAVPMIARGRTIGALTFSWSESGHRYTAEDLALAEDLARRAALAVDNARLYTGEQVARREAERAADRTARLQELTAALSEALTPREVTRVVVEQGVAALGAQAGAITLLGDDETLEVVGSVGYPSEVLEPFQRFPLSAPLPLAESVRTAAPVWLESPAASADRYPHLAGAQAVTGSAAWAAIPLLQEGRAVGALSLSFDEPRVFRSEDRELMVAFARQCVQALERARLYDAARRARAEAEAAQERVASILRSISDAFVALDREWRITYLNPHAEQLLEQTLDRPSEHLVGRRLWEVVPEAVGTAFADHLQRAMAEQVTVEFEEHSPRLGRWFVVHAYPSNDVLSIAFQDVTERKRAEEALRFLAEASELLAVSLDYQTTLANVARLAVPRLADWCAVDVVAEDGTIERLAVAHADPARVELAGELQRRSAPDAGAPTGVLRVLRTGESELHPEITDELLARAASNAEHLALLRSLGLRSAMIVPLVARGRTLGALTFVAAESGRRYDPADLALAEDVARRAALAVDNARLYQEAQEALRARNAFLSSVSHDLKSPLAAIKGYAQLLQRQATRRAGTEGRRVAEVAERIDAATTRMAEQLDELLDLARLQMGQPLALDLEPVDLVDLARQVVEQQQATTERHRLRLEPAVPSLVGRWDAHRLERVLANLIVNAIKYSPEGGEVAIEVAREAEAGRSWAVVRVRDQGIGIPAADLPHVFERFFRARNVAGQVAGSGIGLASARQIVEQHQGTISAASEEGAGSTFTVRLPLEPGEADANG